MVRLLVTSAAYRQASTVTAALLAKDPDNRLLAKGIEVPPGRRAVADGALHMAGLAVLQMGGKGVKPYQPPNIWEPVGFVGSNTREYRQDKGALL